MVSLKRTNDAKSLRENTANWEALVVNQAPSISDMARDNMSSEGTHSYSHDRPAPSWNDLNDRDSSEMMSESDNMQWDELERWLDF
ncbi:hypothetical protein Tco_0436142 [Tanacetum coccineum]